MIVNEQEIHESVVKRIEQRITEIAEKILDEKKIEFNAQLDEQIRLELLKITSKIISFYDVQKMGNNILIKVDVRDLEKL